MRSCLTPQQKLLYHPFVNFVRRNSSLLATRSSMRMGHVNAARPDQQRLSPGSLEHRYIGCEGDDRRVSVHRTARNRIARYVLEFSGSGAASRRPDEWLREWARVAHQPDGDFGPGCVGDDVGRAATRDRRRCSECCGRAEYRLRQRNVPDFFERRRATCRWPIRLARDTRNAPAPVRFEFVSQHALGCQRQLVFGGLAVDQDSANRADRARQRMRRRCCAPRPRRRAARNFALPAASKSSAAPIMAAMMPLASAEPRPQMNSSSSLEGKNGGTVSICVDSVTFGRAPNKQAR